jgi:hypothetical protein
VPREVISHEIPHTCGYLGPYGVRVRGVGTYLLYALTASPISPR